MENRYAINVRVKERQPIRTFVVHAGDAADAKRKVLAIIERETPGVKPAAIDVLMIGT